MLRTIWMVVEGILAAFGVFTIALNTVTFIKCAKDPKVMAAANDFGRKLYDEKQD